MNFPYSFAVLAVLLLAACQPPLEPEAPVDLRAELVPRVGKVPPKGPESDCWAAAVTPAIIETTTEQVQVSPERRAEDGSLISAAVFRSATHQQIVQDRRDVWFRAPCPTQLTVEFVATLQRALKARGLYLHPITGQLDAATRVAIRRYQEPRGLDSVQLSLAAARSLGIVAGDFRH